MQPLHSPPGESKVMHDQPVAHCHLPKQWSLDNLKGYQTLDSSQYGAWHMIRNLPPRYSAKI